MDPRFVEITYSLIDFDKTWQDHYQSFLAVVINDSHSDSSFLSSHYILKSFVSLGRKPCLATYPYNSEQEVMVQVGEEEDFKLLCINQAF